MRAFLTLLILVAAILRPVKAFAVDESGIKIQDKWSVVGVISEDERKGIVVLKNNVSKKTFTLAIGDAVPTEFGFVVQSAKNRQVILTDGKRQVALAFAEASSTGEADDGLSPTNRFLDNYYRGLSENPVEILGPATESEPDRVENQTGTMLPLKRFGTLREDGRSRFDLYRADRMYRMNQQGEEPATEEEPEDEGFVVNYDNFDDGQQEPSFVPPLEE